MIFDFTETLILVVAGLTNHITNVQVYQYSRVDIQTNNGRSIQDYNIVFVLVSLTVIAPVIIQYSSRINVLYHKGVFQQDKLAKLGRKERFLLYIELTFGGILKIIGI